MVGANGLSFDVWGMPELPQWGGYAEPDSVGQFNLTGWQAHRRRYQNAAYDEDFSCFDEGKWTTTGIGAVGSRDSDDVGAYFAFVGYGSLTFPKTCRLNRGHGRGFKPVPPEHDQNHAEYGLQKKSVEAVGAYGFEWIKDNEYLSVPCAWRTSDPLVGPMTVYAEIHNPVMVLNDDDGFQLNAKHCDDTMVYLTSKPYMDFDDYDYGFYVYVKFGCDNGRLMLASPTGDHIEWDSKYIDDARGSGTFDAVEYDYDTCNFTYNDVRDIVIDIQQCSVVVADTKGLCSERLFSIPYDGTPLYVYLGASMNDPALTTGVFGVNNFRVSKTLDNPEWVGPSEGNCTEWLGKDCESSGWEGQAQDDLLANCPVACAAWQCSPAAAWFPTPTPTATKAAECIGARTDINMGINPVGRSKTIPGFSNITSCDATAVLGNAEFAVS